MSALSEMDIRSYLPPQHRFVPGSSILRITLTPSGQVSMNMLVEA